MTAPVRMDEDPLDALKAMRAQSQPAAPSDDPLEQLKAMRGGSPQGDGNKFHAEYQKGLLAKRMQRENTNDAEAAAVDDVSGPGAFGRSLAATGANIAQGIPGMEAAQAGIRSVARRQPYREALSDIQGQTGKIPGVLRGAERIAGAVPLAAMLPASPALSGAIVGGADQALSANPDESLTERGWRTAAGAAGGALLGKGVDKAVTIGKALIPSSLGGAGSSVDRLIQMQADRAKAATQLYGSALGEGQGKAPTQQLLDYINEPEIADRIAKLRELEPLKNLPPESPQMLDALYKSFSDEAKAIKKGAGALDPTKINLGRFRGQDIAGKQQRLLDALSTPGKKPPMTLDVPAGVHETEPNIVPGREPMSGPPASGTLDTYTSGATPDTRQALRNFRAGESPDVARQGPAGPAFQLRAQPERVTPGVRIETPAMRVQTAPAEDIPSMMPGYRKAVDDFRQRSQEIDALQKGYEAVRAGQSNSLPSAKNLTRKTPQAFAEWVKTATPQEIQAARQGILGATKDALSQPGLTFAPGRRAAGNAANLLRLAPTTNQTLLEGMQNLGLLTAGNSTPH